MRRGVVFAVLCACGHRAAVAKDAPPDVAIDAAAPANRVFVTSQSFDGALGGAAGADAKCAAAAAAAGLDGMFIAAVSTSTTNAIDRLAGARGWVRVDGIPFADMPSAIFPSTFCDACDELVLAPPLDEYGQVVSGYAWTGTTSRGTYNGNGCTDWTTTAGSGGIGALNTVFDGFAYAGQTCATQLHLYCFEVDRVTSITRQPPQGRILFVSTPRAAPGLAGLDARCAADAAAAGLPGAYHAATATNTTTIASRFVLDARPWVRVDGAVVADGPSIFQTTRSYAHELADGRYAVLPEFAVGSPTATDAGITQYTCNDWASFASTDTAIVGNGGFLTPTFWDYSTNAFATCDATIAALCLQD
jgi:hypothetical protein